MSARAYSMEKRRISSARTRRRILEAARRLLAEGGDTDLSLDAIARAADVSRLTIYNQFRSRAGLLEALYDYLAARGNMRQAAEILRSHDPAVMVVSFVRTLAAFWSSDPAVIRRLHAMAALDTEIARGLAAREARRRRAAVEIVRRAAPATGSAIGARGRRVVANMLCTLASFETYDALKRARHGQKEIIAVVTRLAELLLTSYHVEG